MTINNIHKMTPNKEWVIVFSSKKIYEIEHIQIILEEENIESHIINKQDSSYLIGEAELYVKSTDLEKAITIIKNEVPDK